jgi:hypothetical protein
MCCARSSSIRNLPSSASLVSLALSKAATSTAATQSHSQHRGIAGAVGLPAAGACVAALQIGRGALIPFLLYYQMSGSMTVSPSSGWPASADTSCPFSLSWQVRVSVSVAISIATHREFGNIYCYTALDSLQTVVCAHATQPSIWDTARYDVLYANNLDN